jgi:hypothetical protein
MVQNELLVVGRHSYDALVGNPLIAGLLEYISVPQAIEDPTRHGPTRGPIYDLVQVVQYILCTLWQNAG